MKSDHLNYQVIGFNDNTFVVTKKHVSYFRTELDPIVFGQQLSQDEAYDLMDILRKTPRW